MKIKLLLPLLLLSLFVFSTGVAQNSSQVLVLEQSSFKPVQTDALTGVNIDPIGLDSSRRPCARIKLHINRMTKAEINDIEVRLHSNNELKKCKTAEYDNGLIIEMTAKPQTRFYLHHKKYGDSEEIMIDLEANKEYLMEAHLNILYPITIASNVVDASIYIDNEYVGTTNAEFVLTVQDVMPGEHKLKVEYGGAVQERVINVHAGSVYFRQDVNTQANIPQHIVFRVKPSNAMVEIEGALLSATSTDGDYAVMSKSFRQGSYQYTVTAPDYHTKSGTIVVRDSKVVQSVELDPAFGYLEIGGDNLNGATVYVDEHKLGTMPMTKTQLASGEHPVKIIKPRYKPYSTKVTITDSNTTTINPHLEENFARVSFTADEGVEIWLNGEKIGTTRANQELEIGSYSVEGHKEGCEKSVQVVDITSTATKVVAVKAPTPMYGSLSIESDQLFAKVTIDGREAGETPLTIPKLLAGRHTVTITKQGYATYTKQIEITKGHLYQLNATLTKATASSTPTVSSKPAKSTTPKSTTPTVTTPKTTTPKTTTPKAKTQVNKSIRFESSIDGGYAIYSAESEISQISLSYIGGLRAGKSLFFGLGVGVEYILHSIDNQEVLAANTEGMVMGPGTISVPIYLHARAYMGSKANNFISLSAGAKMFGKDSFVHNNEVYKYHTNGMFGEVGYGLAFGKLYILAAATAQSMPSVASYTSQQLDLNSTIVIGGKISIGFTF